MPPTDNRLLIHRLRAAVEPSLAPGTTEEERWAAVDELLGATAWEDTALEGAVRGRDAAEVARRIAEWDAGKQPFPAPDRAVLKRALKAFRKRLKLQQLDDESRIGGGPFSGGRQSSIVAIQPPGPYPQEVWDELARQGRLHDASQGFFELAEE